MTADAREPGAQEVAHQEEEPVFVGPAVGVGEGDEGAGGRLDAGVAGRAQTEVPGMPEADDAWEQCRDRGGGIGRSVIDEDHLVVGIIEMLERLEAGLEGGGAVVAGDHHRDLRSRGQRKIGRDAELLAHRFEGRFGGAIGPGQPEGPIVDEPSAMPPFVGVGIDDHAGATAAKGALDLPMEHLRLTRRAFAQGVDADLSEDERSGVGEHLQAGQIVLEGLAIVQVDVEAQEVGRLGLQEFGGREIAEGAQQFGILGLGGADQVVEESGHRGGPAPADDVGGDLVGHAEREDRRVSGAAPGGGADQFDQLPTRLVGIEEALLSVPRHIDQELQPVLVGQVEEPSGGHVVDSEQVGSQAADLSEVPPRGLRRGERRSLVARGQRTVGDPLGMEFRGSEAETLSVHRDPDSR